jgi:hypothetical protein
LLAILLGRPVRIKQGGFVEDVRQPLPSILQQRAIVAFLDRETARIDALVAEAPLCFATVIALSNSDIAPREEGILGIKATK